MSMLLFVCQVSPLRLRAHERLSPKDIYGPFLD